MAIFDGVKFTFFFRTKSELDSSKPTTLSQLYAMEIKFKENLEFVKQCKDFRNQCKNLGFVELITKINK